jgi:hypothetical protein
VNTSVLDLFTIGTVSRRTRAAGQVAAPPSLRAAALPRCR